MVRKLLRSVGRVNVSRVVDFVARRRSAGAMKRKGRRDTQPTFETLEPRVLLSTTPSAPTAVIDDFQFGTGGSFLSGDGLMNVQVINTTGTNPGNNTANWLSVWDALDGGAGPTGSVAGFNVVNNTSDTDSVFFSVAGTDNLSSDDGSLA